MNIVNVKNDQLDELYIPGIVKKILDNFWKIDLYPFWAFCDDHNFFNILWVLKKNYIFGIRKFFSLYPAILSQFWGVSLPKVRESYRRSLLNNLGTPYLVENNFEKVLGCYQKSINDIQDDSA